MQHLEGEALVFLVADDGGLHALLVQFGADILHGGLQRAAHEAQHRLARGEVQDAVQAVTPAVLRVQRGRCHVEGAGLAAVSLLAQAVGHGHHVDEEHQREWQAGCDRDRLQGRESAREQQSQRDEAGGGRPEESQPDGGVVARRESLAGQVGQHQRP